MLGQCLLTYLNDECVALFFVVVGCAAGAHEGGDGGEAGRGRLLAAAQRRLVVLAELVGRVPGVYSVERPCSRQ